MPKPPPLPNASSTWWDRNWKWFATLLGVVGVVIGVGFLVLMRGLSQAAQEDRGRMLNNLGARYEQGDGVPQDPQRAFGLYQQAAALGNAVAAFNLGVMYDQGNVVAEDRAVANDWYRKSADQGYPSAMLNLGCNFANGDGMAEDPVEAMMWFELAQHFMSLEKNSPLLPKARDTHDQFKPRLSESQLAEASKRSEAWLAAYESRRMKRMRR